jgi:hypothetical protein
MLYGLIGLAFAWVSLNVYWAVRSREYRKFLAGAFFVSWGTQVYFYFAKVSVPLLGTDFTLTPEISLWRSFPHLILFLLCLYFGFFRRPKAERRASSTRSRASTASSTT